MTESLVWRHFIDHTIVVADALEALFQRLEDLEDETWPAVNDHRIRQRVYGVLEAAAPRDGVEGME
jgi:hypothetical protein